MTSVFNARQSAVYCYWTSLVSPSLCNVDE